VLGVNVYGVVPAIVVLITAGDQTPTIEFSEVVGNNGAVEPEHIGAIVVKVGVIIELIVTVPVAVAVQLAVVIEIASIKLPTDKSDVPALTDTKRME